MSEQEHNSPNIQVRAAEEARTPEVLERRRKLMRMVGTGVPLILSLPTRASAQTLNSAYRAAQQDAIRPPSLMANTKDGWIRVEAQRHHLKAGGGYAYKFNGDSYFYSDSGAHVQSNDVQGPVTTVYLAVLFQTDFNRGSAGAHEMGAWPKYVGVGQALHLSSWSSLSPRGYKNNDWAV